MKKYRFGNGVIPSDTHTMELGSKDFARNYSCTCLLLLLVLELERGLDAAALVEKAAPHVDLADVAEVKADEVERQVEDEVCEVLLHELAGVVDPLCKII